jgi:hypothetical protein
MNNCKEYALDDLLAVTAIPVADYGAADKAEHLKPLIDGNHFTPTLANSITIGLTAAVAGGRLIPVMRGSGKAKDAEADTVAGRLHTVTVTCEADDRDSMTWDHMLALERTPCHLVLTFRGGTRAFVEATEDTYLCTKERDGSKTSITLRIQDTMGIQMIV